MTDVEARSRLLSILDVLEHEVQALQAIEDPRLNDVLRTMTELRFEIAATVGEFDDDIRANGGSP